MRPIKEEGSYYAKYFTNGDLAWLAAEQETEFWPSVSDLKLAGDRIFVGGVFVNNSTVSQWTPTYDTDFDLSPTESLKLHYYGSGDIFVTKHDGYILQVGSVQKKEALVSFYPNPANSTVVVAGASSNAQTIQIHDAAGQLVLSEMEAILDVSELDCGFYLLTVVSDEGRRSAPRSIIR